MPYKPVQILTPHADNCPYREETDWSRPWVLPEHKGFGEVRRDLTGRNNANAKHEWLKFRCNHTGCHGELIVYLPFVMARIRESWEEIQLVERRHAVHKDLARYTEENP